MKFFFIYVLFAAVFPLSTPAFAQTVADYMNRGNAAYRAGDYSLAVELYEKANTSNADLFYNRANAHIKKGEIGMATVYYIRALRIKPRDADIRSNLEYARTLRADRMETEKENRAMALVGTPYRMLSINEHAFAALSIFTLLVILMGLYYSFTNEKARARGRVAAFILILLLFLQITATAFKTYNEMILVRAVVTTEKVTAFTAPSVSSEKVFELHEGTEVILKRNENDFALIVLPTGWTGWVAKKALAII